MEATKYSLRVKDSGKILSLKIYQEKDWVGDLFALVENETFSWEVENKYNAEWVRRNSTPLYKGGNNRNNPFHEFKTEELEVVKVESSNNAKSISIANVFYPSHEEFIKFRYRKSPSKRIEKLIRNVTKHPQRSKFVCFLEDYIAYMELKELEQ